MRLALEGVEVPDYNHDLTETLNKMDYMHLCQWRFLV